MNSSAQGVAGCAMMRATARIAAAVSRYVARSVRTAKGFGVSLSVTSVITARVPSEPTSRRVRS